MSHVFAALDQRTGGEVAIKVLDADRSERPEARARFEREIALVATLQHPNTIRVTDCGTTDDGRPFLVMELLEGTALDAFAQAHGPIDPQRVVALLRQVLRSLAQAHGAGVVHRDIKPANVFLVDAGQGESLVKVLDFGISKRSDDLSLTASSEVPCSPHYVAPERILFARDTPAGDVYSVGVMAIELLEGTPPYSAPTSMGLLMQHGDLDTPVPLTAATRALPFGDVIERAVQKHADARYPDAGAMLQALDRALPDRRLVFTEDLHRAVPLDRPEPYGVTLRVDTTSDAVVALRINAEASSTVDHRKRAFALDPFRRWFIRGVIASIAAALAVALATRLTGGTPREGDVAARISTEDAPAASGAQAVPPATSPVTPPVVPPEATSEAARRAAVLSTAVRERALGTARVEAARRTTAARRRVRTLVESGRGAPAAVAPTPSVPATRTSVTETAPTPEPAPDAPAWQGLGLTPR
jgi:serine/threonine-protein kinase